MWRLNTSTCIHFILVVSTSLCNVAFPMAHFTGIVTSYVKNICENLNAMNNKASTFYTQCFMSLRHNMVI